MIEARFSNRAFFISAGTSHRMHAIRVSCARNAGSHDAGPRNQGTRSVGISSASASNSGDSSIKTRNAGACPRPPTDNLRPHDPAGVEVTAIAQARTSPDRIGLTAMIGGCGHEPEEHNVSVFNCLGLNAEARSILG
ncbi:hypothetical protein ACILG0_20350 [Pseudomonadota bacterium AL_CKDN230030165-1A_HGKHYDSX7]